MDALDRYKCRVVDELSRLCAPGERTLNSRRIQEATSHMYETNQHIKNRRGSVDKTICAPRSPIRTRSISRAESGMLFFWRDEISELFLCHMLLQVFAWTGMFD